MADLVVITHPDDRYEQRNAMLRSVASFWEEAGHRVTVASDPERLPDGDLGILHVDLSVVPEAFHQVHARYPHVVNGRVFDIRKHRVSQSILRREDAWEGPVVVKTDLNCYGHPEQAMRARLLSEGRPIGTLRDAVVGKTSYPVYASLRAMPSAVWDVPGLVVERFLPEVDGEGTWMRCWVFLGDEERCSRLRGSEPIIKSSNIVELVPCAVPDALRAERERLGFDYGKFDFVVHDGVTTLFDANKTPSDSPAQLQLNAPNRALARGIRRWLRS